MGLNHAVWLNRPELKPLERGRPSVKEEAHPEAAKELAKKNNVDPP